jgi:hypothetical protein
MDVQHLFFWNSLVEREKPNRSCAAPERSCPFSEKLFRIRFLKRSVNG